MMLKRKVNVCSLFACKREILNETAYLLEFVTDKLHYYHRKLYREHLATTRNRTHSKYRSDRH